MHGLLSDRVRLLSGDKFSPAFARDPTALSLRCEALAEIRVGIQRPGDFREAVPRGKNGVEVRFDCGRQPDCFEPFGAIERVVGNVLPETRCGEESCDAFRVLALQKAHQIGGNPHLKSV
jgi:hypothetical protein